MEYYHSKENTLHNGFRILKRKNNKDEYDLWIGTYDEINGTLKEVDFHIVVYKSDLKELKERITVAGI